MKKLYKLTMYTGNNSSIIVILEDVEIQNGIIHGTQVGVLRNIDINGEQVFEEIEKVVFMASGAPWTLIEYTGDLV